MEESKASSCNGDIKSKTGQSVNLVSFIITCVLIFVSFFWIAYIHYQLVELAKRQADQQLSTVHPGGRYRRGKSAAIGIPNNEDIFGDQEIDHQKNKKKQRKQITKAYEEIYTATESLNNARKTLERAMSSKHPYHPSVHLVAESQSNTKQHRVIHDDLTWTVHNNAAHSTGDTGQYNGLQNFFEFNSKEQVINIKKNGRYHIYAQLTFNGHQDNSNLTSPSCGYGVGLEVDEHRQYIHLLYKYVTQYQLGRMIQYDTTIGQAVYAHDSAYVAGVFILRGGEKLELTPAPGVPCYVRTEADKTFFGMWLLSEVS